MIGRALAALRAVAGTFGLRVAPALAFGGWLTLRAVVAVGMALDPLLFPRLRRTRVRAPVVIVGSPRTGTTFLQRYLDGLGVGAGMPLWRAVYPSLTLQVLVRPLLPWLERVSPARWHATAAHETGLTKIETDDAALFLRYADGFFLYAFFLAFSEEDARDRFDPRLRDTTARDVGWLLALWRRNLVASGQDRVVAKLFSLSARLPAFLEQVPDARVLWTVRDPVEVIPSAMSLVTGVLDRALGFWRLPEAVRERYLERLYQGLVSLLRRFEEDRAAGRIPADRVLVVPYERLRHDLEAMTEEILQFTGASVDAEGRRRIAEIAASQRRYASAHQYDLARFGLDADRVRRDCAFLATGAEGREGAVP